MTKNILLGKLNILWSEGSEVKDYIFNFDLRIILCAQFSCNSPSHVNPPWPWWDPHIYIVQVYVSYGLLLDVQGFVEVMVWKFDIGFYKDNFVELKELKQTFLEKEYQTIQGNLLKVICFLILNFIVQQRHPKDPFKNQFIRGWPTQLYKHLSFLWIIQCGTLNIDYCIIARI